MSDPVGPLELAAKAAFYLVAGLTVGGAWMAVSARNLFRSALGLALALIGVAAVYLFLQAEFLAVAQLLVYVGAILMLIVFGVMLTAKIADPETARWNAQVKIVFSVCAVLAGGLICAFLKAPWADSQTGEGVVSLSTLGQGLVGPYLLAFELLSVLLVGALVGAIWIARKEKEEEPK